MNQKLLDQITEINLQSIFEWFLSVLFMLDYTLDQLTESNWAKLKDRDKNGWSKILES